MRLLTLNLANPPADRAKALLEWLWHRPEEVLVLTEVGTGRGSDLVIAVCHSAGHDVHVTDRTSLGVVVVGRGVELRPEEGPLPAVLPGRVAAVRVGGLRVAGVYGAASDPVRYAASGQRRRKREWLAAFEPWLAGWVEAGPPSGNVLLGDLNLVDPQHDSQLPDVLDEETATYEQLTRRHGLVDAYRLHHPTDTAPSWVDHSGAGCRYDHAFVSAGLAAATTSCTLVHEPRLVGLTDHSALTLGLSVE